MEFEYTMTGKGLLTVDAIRALYVALPAGGFLSEEGLEVRTTDGAHVDVGGGLGSVVDTLSMLAGGPVEYASLSHRPVYSFALAGVGYWRVELSAVDAETVKVSIDSDSRSKVKELKGIVDAYLVPKGSIPPQPEPVPADEYQTSS